MHSHSHTTTVAQYHVKRPGDGASYSECVLVVLACNAVLRNGA